MKMLFTAVALSLIASQAHATPLTKAMAAKFEVLCTDNYSVVREIDGGAPSLARGGITWLSTDGLGLVPVGENQLYARYERTFGRQRHLVEFVVKDHRDFGVSLETRYSITGKDGRTVSASAADRLGSKRMEAYLKDGNGEGPRLEVAINGRVPREVEEMSEAQRNAVLARQGFRNGDFSHQGVRCGLYQKP